MDRIKSKCGLDPITDSFNYVKELQAEFDLSQIPYTEDYYDPEMNAEAPELPTEWKVCYSGGFWTKNSKEKPGEEIVINKSFAWGDEIWHIPVAYSCSKGLVVDFCVEIAPEKVKAFIDKWYSIFANYDNISNEIREQSEQENPLHVDFSPYIFINSKEVFSEHGSSVSWTSDFCLPEGVRNERESKELIKHYGLDENRCWSFHRCSFPWATAGKPEIKSIILKLERELTTIQGIHFKNPSVGDVITFVHPIYNTEHRLTVYEYEKQEFPLKGFQDKEYEYPTYHTAMAYTLEPELPAINFQVRDCLPNEQPKRKLRNQFEPQAGYDACVAIIGGADGITGAMLSSGKELKKHCALSALHFEATDDVEWKTVFREKMTEDIEIELFG